MKGFVLYYVVMTFIHNYVDGILRARTYQVTLLRPMTAVDTLTMVAPHGGRICTETTIILIHGL